MWSLKIVKGSELAEKPVAEWRLPQPLPRVTIGRDPTSDWLLADRTLAISAHHCEIVDSPWGPMLTDLSTNGTFVNGASARLSGQHVLRDGDRLELGPFDVLVSGPPMPPRPAAATHSASTVSGLPRGAGVHATAPQRGGDPAAMLARGGGKDLQGLTEILRAAPPSVDSGLDLTRIREVVAAPKPAAAGPVLQAAATQATASPQATQQQDLAVANLPAAPALAQALARGLGVPVSALEGQDLLQLVEQLAAAARTAHAALKPIATSINAVKAGT
jgi:type VI secretion system protein ImpI